MRSSEAQVAPAPDEVALDQRGGGGPVASLELIVGEAQRLVAGFEGRGVAAPVAPEAELVAVVLPAVDLDDQPLAREQDVDLLAGNARVDEGFRKSVAFEEGEEAALEL